LKPLALEEIMENAKKFIGEVDLNEGVVPITKAASSLASLIKRSHSHQQPIVVTQKGYPTGVILDVELFTMLRENAERYLDTLDAETRAERSSIFDRMPQAIDTGEPTEAV
jgi:prevent-host-death family protein